MCWDRQALPLPKSRHCGGSACPEHSIHSGTTLVRPLTSPLQQCGKVNNHMLCSNEWQIDD